MIATVRVRGQTESQFLCQLDIMRFSKESILMRMKERGISEDSFFVAGISDWGVDTILTLDEVYLLRKCIEGLYDGDEFVVKYLMEQHKSVGYIISHYWNYHSKNELEVMQFLLKGIEGDRLLKLFFDMNNWVSMFSQYVAQGYILNTPKGFYIQV